MDNTNFNIGNISTIVKYLSMLIAGWFIGLLVSHGINLPIETTGLSEVISAIIFLVLAHVDATNPNTIFNNNNADTIIPDIDPASEYEVDGDDT